MGPLHSLCLTQGLTLNPNVWADYKKVRNKAVGMLRWISMGRRIGHYCDVSNINAKRQKYMSNYLFHMLNVKNTCQTFYFIC